MDTILYYIIHIDEKLYIKEKKRKKALFFSKAITRKYLYRKEEKRKEAFFYQKLLLFFDPTLQALLLTLRSLCLLTLRSSLACSFGRPKGYPYPYPSTPKGLVA